MVITAENTVTLEPKNRGLEPVTPPVRGVRPQEDVDMWWTVARRAFDRSLDVDRLEETLRLRTNNSGE